MEHELEFYSQIGNIFDIRLQHLFGQRYLGMAHCS